MHYREPELIEPDEVERLLDGGVVEALAAALVGLALHHPDLGRAQDLCLRALDHESVEVRSAALTSLGHLARIHGRLDMNRVLPKLERALRDPETQGVAEDALGDIRPFTR